jgi:hypothetical protein
MNETVIVQPLLALRISAAYQLLVGILGAVASTPWLCRLSFYVSWPYVLSAEMYLISPIAP